MKIQFKWKRTKNVAGSGSDCVLCHSVSGSGAAAAVSVFEDRFKPKMEVSALSHVLLRWYKVPVLFQRLSPPPSSLLLYTQLEEAKTLVRDAIAAGIFCDLGSGSNVDLCVITKEGVQYLRGFDQPTQKGQRWVMSETFSLLYFCILLFISFFYLSLLCYSSPVLFHIPYLCKGKVIVHGQSLPNGRSKCLYWNTVHEKAKQWY